MLIPKWKPFLGYSLEGRPFRNDGSSFGKDTTLLERIRAMPKGKPISFAAAHNLYWYEIVSSIIDHLDSDTAGEITNQDWVGWITKQGFQITLTGNEYQLVEETTKRMDS